LGYLFAGIGGINVSGAFGGKPIAGLIDLDQNT
jgi:hypothetical protein